MSEMANDQVKSQRTIAERAGIRWPSVAQRTMRGEGAASGIRLDAWSAVRYTFREGLILRVDGAIEPDRDRALDALGAMVG
jgi:hypothetical protein